MKGSLHRIALRHEAVVTVALLLALLLNLVAVGYVDPPQNALDRELPMAAQCQGGGAGCVAQPLIPPPAIGLPRFQAPPAAAFGVALAIEPARLAALHAPPIDDIKHPPVLNAT